MSPKRFRIALSFSGETRNFVARVASSLAKTFGKDRILYDKYHEAEFAPSDLGIHLPRLYHEDSELIVVFISKDYEHKEWCGLEWPAIHALLKRRLHSDVMLCRFDNAQVDGLYDTAGFVELNDKTPKEVAFLILERLATNEGHPRDYYRSKRSGAGFERFKATASRIINDALTAAPRLRRQVREQCEILKVIYFGPLLIAAAAIASHLLAISLGFALFACLFIAATLPAAGPSQNRYEQWFFTAFLMLEALVFWTVASFPTALGVTLLCVIATVSMKTTHRRLITYVALLVTNILLVNITQPSNQLSPEDLDEITRNQDNNQPVQISDPINARSKTDLIVWADPTEQQWIEHERTNFRDPKWHVTFTFAGSSIAEQRLRKAIEAGTRLPDLWCPADIFWVQKLIFDVEQDSGLLGEKDREQGLTRHVGTGILNMWPSDRGRITDTLSLLDNFVENPISLLSSRLVLAFKRDEYAAFQTELDKSGGDPYRTLLNLVEHKDWHIVHSDPTKSSSGFAFVYDLIFNSRLHPDQNISTLLDKLLKCKQDSVCESLTTGLQNLLDKDCSDNSCPYFDIERSVQSRNSDAAGDTAFPTSSSQVVTELVNIGNVNTPVNAVVAYEANVYEVMSRYPETPLYMVPLFPDTYANYPAVNLVGTASEGDDVNRTERNDGVLAFLWILRNARKDARTYGFRTTTVAKKANSADSPWTRAWLRSHEEPPTPADLKKELVDGITHESPVRNVRAAEIVFKWWQKMEFAGVIKPRESPRP